MGSESIPRQEIAANDNSNTALVERDASGEALGWEAEAARDHESVKTWLTTEVAARLEAAESSEEERAILEEIYGKHVAYVQEIGSACTRLDYYKEIALGELLENSTLVRAHETHQRNVRFGIHANAAAANQNRFPEPPQMDKAA